LRIESINHSVVIFINSKYAKKRQCKLEVDDSHRSSPTSPNVK